MAQPVVSYGVQEAVSKIWWVEDYLSGEVIDNKHYSDKAEAVTERNRLGYGIVKSWEPRPEGGAYEESAGRKLVVFPE